MLCRVFLQRIQHLKHLPYQGSFLDKLTRFRTTVPRIVYEVENNVVVVAGVGEASYTTAARMTDDQWAELRQKFSSQSNRQALLPKIITKIMLEIPDAINAPSVDESAGEAIDKNWVSSLLQSYCQCLCCWVAFDN